MLIIEILSQIFASFTPLVWCVLLVCITVILLVCILSPTGEGRLMQLIKDLRSQARNGKEERFSSLQDHQHTLRQVSVTSAADERNEKNETTHEH